MNELNGILEFSPLVLLVVALNCLGLLLKRVNWHPDRLIPMTLPFVGAAIWGMIGDAAPVSWISSAKHPEIVNMLVGFVAGSVSVWGNQAVRQLVTKEPE